jgi:hypothetical protein
MIKKSIKTTLVFTFAVSVCKCIRPMSGTIKDSSGMSLPGATVLVREQQM